MKPLGLYLHIPFCKSKCLYCDFCSLPRPTEETLERYTDALCRELTAWSERCRAHTVDTVYLGGGTPTLLPIKALERIIDTVRKCYHVSPTAEITSECNPSTGGTEYFLQMHRLGIHRLSIGLQSTHADELKALGRTHSFADFCKTWESARAAGFDNLSADVMSGIPHQTPHSWLETLRSLTALSPEHVSAYGLILEDGTPLARRADTLPLPDEDAAERMYFDGIDYLESQGLHLYEISNFAKSGYESRHNLKYWCCDEFLGFGPAAYSDFGGARFGNSRDVSAYLDKKSILEETETPSQAERMNEYVMLRMRLAEGIDASAFEQRFSLPFSRTFGNALEKYLPAGFVKKTPHGYAFTPRGMYVSNAILSDILDFSDKSEKTY